MSQARFTHTEENYIKSIYHLAADGEENVSTNALAEHMHTRPATVSDMIKRLARKDILSYQKYQGVSLTDMGNKVAVNVIRKHRLWEVFLYEKLDFHWDEVHDIAEQLEHIQSPLLIEKLDAFLGSPTVDPHGDPIPDVNGNFNTGPQQPLAEIATNEQVVVVSVVDGNPRLLQFLDKKGIRLGLKLRVLEKEEFDGSILLELNEGNTSFFSKEITESIMVKKI